MKLAASLFLAAAVLATAGWWFYGNQQERNNQAMIDSMRESLAKEDSEVIGFVQEVSAEKNTVLIRRKNRMPFMPRRELVQLKANTEILNNEETIALQDLKLGQLIRVQFKGDALKDNSYIADRIEIAN